MLKAAQLRSTYPAKIKPSSTADGAQPTGLGRASPLTRNADASYKTRLVSEPESGRGGEANSPLNRLRR